MRASALPLRLGFGESCEIAHLARRGERVGHDGHLILVQSERHLPELALLAGRQFRHGGRRVDANR